MFILIRVLLFFCVTLSFSTKASPNECGNINELLESLDIDVDIDSVFEFKHELRKRWGGSALEGYFYRYLEEMNPYFKTDGSLDFHQVKWAKEFVDSDYVKKFKTSLNYVKVNPTSLVSVTDAKYLISKELAKLDSVFLKNDFMNEVNVIVTHDNVTTYWKHLDGVQVRGHPDGITWNSIPGAGAPPGETELVIALVKDNDGNWQLPKGNHGSNNIVLHEYGHAVDYLIGKVFPKKETE